MSMEFSVILNEKIDLVRLRRNVQSVLREMLNLPFHPNIEARDNGAGPNCLAENGDTVAFALDGVGEAVVMVLDLPHDASAPLSKKPTAVISAGSIRTAESWVLAIALAVALAQTTNAKVIDDLLLLSNDLEGNPTALVDKIKLLESQDDLSRASHRLLTRLGIV